MSGSVTNFFELLQQEDSGLQYFARKAALFQSLSDTIRPLLKPVLRPYCHVVNVSKDTVVLATPSSAYTAKLRYYVSDLLAVFAGDPQLRHFKKIRCKTLVSGDSGVGGKVRPCVERSLSPVAQECLQALSGVLSDDNLADAVNRLVKHSVESG